MAAGASVEDATHLWDSEHRTESIADLAVSDAGVLWLAGWTGTGGQESYVGWVSAAPRGR